MRKEKKNCDIIARADNPGICCHSCFYYRIPNSILKEIAENPTSWGQDQPNFNIWILRACMVRGSKLYEGEAQAELFYSTREDEVCTLWTEKPYTPFPLRIFQWVEKDGKKVLFRLECRS